QFNKIDTDQNGTISKDEFIKSLQAKLPANADASAVADKVFSKLDTNGDGQISQTEFTSGRPRFGNDTGKALLSAQEADQSTDPTTDPNQLAQQLLAKYDTNQDGTLTQDELATSLGGT